MVQRPDSLGSGSHRLRFCGFLPVSFQALHVSSGKAASLPMSEGLTCSTSGIRLLASILMSARIPVNRSQGVLRKVVRKANKKPDAFAPGSHKRFG
mgnify:CR=1 FL=1